MARAASGIGLTTGPIHAKARVNGNGVFVIETAPRSIGGRCSRAVRLAQGIRLEEVTLRQALGLPVDARPPEKASGVMMLPIAAAGRLRAVSGVRSAARPVGRRSTRHI